MFVKTIDHHDEVTWDYETEILVIGGGGSGLTAAARASAYDRQVTLVEKADSVGGKTRLSTSQICGVGTRFQADAAIEDSPEALAEDLLSTVSETDAKTYLDPNHIRTVGGYSAEALHWFADHLDVDFHLHTGPYTQAGHSVPRTHYPRNDEGIVPRTGEPLVEPLLQEARSNGVDVHTGTPIEQLVVADGAVVGAIHKADPQPDPRRQVQDWFRADVVVLASDGFNANHDMRLEQFPETASLEHWGVHGNTGEAIRWGESLDAAIEPRHYSAYAFFTEPEGAWLSAELVKEGGFFVNESGDRYMDVGDEPYRMISNKTLEQPDSIGYVVIDQRIVDTLQTATLTQNQFTQTFEEGVFASGETIRELGDELDIDSEALETSLEAVNRGSRGDDPGDEFGRMIEKRLSPPFYGTKVKPRFIRARAGLRIDERTCVQRSDGRAVPNLHAVGNAAESLEGGRPEAYIAGVDLMNTLVTGYMAGTALGESA